MKKVFIFVMVCLCTVTAFSQNAEEIKVKQSIEQLCKAMMGKDSAMIISVMHKSARLHSVSYDSENRPVFQESSILNFVKQITTLPVNVNIEERILSYEIKVDGNLATAWTPYQFYVNKKLRHCGVNAFTLVKDGTGFWKITQIADTRRKDKCE